MTEFSGGGILSQSVRKRRSDDCYPCLSLQQSIYPSLSHPAAADDEDMATAELQIYWVVHYRLRARTVDR